MTRAPGEADTATAGDPSVDSAADRPTGHILVLGTGELTVPVLEEIRDAGDTPVVVVTADGARAEPLSAAGASVVVGDPTDEAVQQTAGVTEATAVVIATSDDAEDALAVLTTRSLAPDVRIVAAVTNRENVDKLEMAGADIVVSPATLGGQMLVRSALEGTGIEELADRILEVGEDAD